jgi:PAS domain S-box-containing protein
MGNSAAVLVQSFDHLEDDFQGQLIPLKLTHGCNLFVQSHSAREAFMRFLRDGSWIESLSNNVEFPMISKIASMKALEKSKSTKDIIAESSPSTTTAGIDNPSNATNITSKTSLLSTNNEMFADYVLPDGTTSSAIQPYFAKDDEPLPFNTDYDVTEIIETCFTMSDMKAVLLASVFPLFLESKEYKNWLDMQERKADVELQLHEPLDTEEEIRQPTLTTNTTNTNSTKQLAISPSKAKLDNNAVTTVDPNSSATMTLSASKQKLLVLDNISHDRNQRLEGLLSNVTKQTVSHRKRTEIIIEQAIRTIDTVEIHRMLTSGDWLEQLLGIVEELPLCVSLATARIDRPGFPLVYVNKAFERTTKYERHDIIGKNCSFLQYENSEKEQIEKLRYALKHAQPVKVALKNKRKDGVMFINLLAMKPIFNIEGVYTYVIGVQYDITNREAASWKEIKLVDDLLAILPNILK